MRYIDHLHSCSSKAGSSPNAQHRSPHPEVELPGDFTTMMRPCRSATDPQLRLSLLSGRGRACAAITGLTDPLPSSPLLESGPDIHEPPDMLRAADVHRRPRLGRADVAVHVGRHPLPSPGYVSGRGARDEGLDPARPRVPDADPLLPPRVGAGASVRVDEQPVRLAELGPDVQEAPPQPESGSRSAPTLETSSRTCSAGDSCRAPQDPSIPADRPRKQLHCHGCGRTCRWLPRMRTAWDPQSVMQSLLARPRYSDVPRTRSMRVRYPSNPCRPDRCRVQRSFASSRCMGQSGRDWQHADLQERSIPRPRSDGVTLVRHTRLSLTRPSDIPPAYTCRTPLPSAVAGWSHTRGAASCVQVATRNRLRSTSRRASSIAPITRARLPRLGSTGKPEREPRSTTGRVGRSTPRLPVRGPAGRGIDVTVERPGDSPETNRKACGLQPTPRETTDAQPIHRSSGESNP